MKLASEQEEREIQALFEQGRTAEEERVQQLWERLHGIDLQYADAQRASRRKDRIRLILWWLAAIAIVAVVIWKG